MPYRTFTTDLEVFVQLALSHEHQASLADSDRVQTFVTLRHWGIVPRIHRATSEENL